MSLESVKKLSQKNCSNFIEPILGESGIIRATNPFKKALEKLLTSTMRC